MPFKLPYTILTKRGVMFCMSNLRKVLLFSLLLVFSFVTAASTQGGCDFFSSLETDPYGKVGQWKEITVQVVNNSGEDFANIYLKAHISPPYGNPLDGSEGELEAEVWDSEQTTWVPANTVYDNGEYVVTIAEGIDLPAGESVDYLFRVKFAECRSALYDVVYELGDSENSITSGPFKLAITDAYEPDNSYEEARETEIGVLYDRNSLLPEYYDYFDWYKIHVDSTNCVYVIETFPSEGCSNVDTMLYLYADPEEEPLAVDDDSGSGLYSKIYYYFGEPGDYYILVVPFDEYEQGYYGLKVSTMTAGMVINGNVYDYEGGTDFSAYAELYNNNGQRVALRPIVNGTFSFEVPAGNYRLRFNPHPESGLVPEWYLNKKTFSTADVITIYDGVFDEETGNFVVYLEDSYLAYEDNAPQVQIISPESNQTIESLDFEASFKVVEDSVKSVSAELYDKNGDLVDGYYYGSEFESGTTYTVNFEVDSDCCYRFVVTAEDESGNVVSEEVSFIVDTEFPEISFDGFDDGGFYTTTVTPRALIDDEHLASSTVKLYRDGYEVEGWANGSPVSEEGDYEVYAEASDVAGHVTTASATFVIDRTKPSISFEGIEDGEWYNTTVTPVVVFFDKHLDTTSAVLYRNGELVEGWTSGDALIEEGEYEIYAEASDMSGNESTASISFYIDTTAPDVEITEPEDGGVYYGTITVDATYSADVQVVEVLVDDEVVSGEVPYELDTALFSDGNHTISVIVYDRAGNVGVDSIDVVFDNFAPVIRIVPEDGSYVSASEIVPEIDIFDATLDDVYCFLDGEVYTPETTITGEGSYELEVIASDSFGRVSRKVSRFVLDATAPEITVQGVEDGEIYNSPVSFSFTASDANLEAVHGTLNGEPVDPDTTITVDRNGTYTLYIHAMDKAGNESTASIEFTLNIPVPATYERVWGTDRYATAVEISKSHFENSEYVVLATGENFPDALAAAPLAKALNAPILLVKKDIVPAVVVDEIERLGATKAIIVGGAGVVSDAVKTALEGMDLAVERIGGINRYETAKLIAEKLAEVIEVESFEKVYIATGENYPDALSASSLAAREACPILLVKKDVIPVETRNFITEYEVTKTVVLGGTGVISDAVMNQLPNPLRLAGPNRYATSVEIARYAFENGLVDDTVIYITTGENYPDALACGAAASRVPAAVLLVPSSLPLKAETETFLTENKQIDTVVVIGGSGAVSDSVVNRILELLN